MSDTGRDAHKGDESPKIKTEDNKVDAEALTNAIEQPSVSSTEQSNTTATTNFAAANSGIRIVTMASKVFEPPAFISETKTYDRYKEDLYMWSRITQVPKENQAEVVVYNLEGHPSGFKEKIVLHIKDKIRGENGIQELVAFLDSIYKADEMADAWSKYKGFQKVARKVANK